VSRSVGSRLLIGGLAICVGLVSLVGWIIALALGVFGVAVTWWQGSVLWLAMVLVVRLARLAFVRSGKD
jgi:hypothetical protein